MRRERGVEHQRITAMRLICLSLVLAVFACGGGNGEAPNSGDATAVAELVLELSIGDDFEADPEYQFSLIRSILITSDRTIWVADITEGAFGGFGRGIPLLRQYDTEGTLIRQVARAGSGPGEYRQPEGIVELLDGRVAVRDLSLPGKVVIFTADGQFSEAWTSNALGLDGMRWVSNNGFALGVDTGGTLWIPIRGERLGPGTPRKTHFIRIQGNGARLNTIDLPPLPAVQGQEVQVVRTLQAGVRVRMPVGSRYQPRAIWAWSPMGTFAIAQTDQYRIEVLPTPSHPTRIIQRDIPPLSVPRGERRAERERMALQISLRAGVPDIPDTKPPIRSMRFTDDGQLLVTVHMPSRLEDGEWTEDYAFDVFDTNGGLRGRVVLPDSFRYMGMRGDTMWGVFRDELEVQSVRIYTVSWP